jgi:hypothetical protein
MTVQELIERLQEIEDAHGNVWVEDDRGRLLKEDGVFLFRGDDAPEDPATDSRAVVAVQLGWRD